MAALRRCTPPYQDVRVQGAKAGANLLDDLVRFVLF
jgi:hypothetical protein